MTTIIYCGENYTHIVVKEKLEKKESIFLTIYLFTFSKTCSLTVDSKSWSSPMSSIYSLLKVAF